MDSYSSTSRARVQMYSTVGISSLFPLTRECTPDVAPPSRQRRSRPAQRRAPTLARPHRATRLRARGMAAHARDARRAPHHAARGTRACRTHTTTGSLTHAQHTAARACAQRPPGATARRVRAPTPARPARPRPAGPRPLPAMCDVPSPPEVAYYSQPLWRCIIQPAMAVKHIPSFKTAIKSRRGSGTFSQRPSQQPCPSHYGRN